MVNYFFHFSWSTTSSIGAGQLPIPLHFVNLFFHWSWSVTSPCSTSSSICGWSDSFPLHLVNDFIHCRYYFFLCCCKQLHQLQTSTTFSIAIGQLILPLQQFNYVFHCSCSTTSSNKLFHSTRSTIFCIAPGQLLVPLQIANIIPLQLVNYFFHYTWWTTYSIVDVQLLQLQLVN